MASFFASLSIALVVIVSFGTLTSSDSIVFATTVAQDGTADFMKISDAIAAAPSHSQTKYFIRIKPGVYDEHVEVGEDKTNIALIGDDMATTIITHNWSNSTGYKTIQSATLSVDGAGFMAKSLTIENSAGPHGGQAVAVKNEAPSSVFYQCVMLGYQDTLYVRQTKQFYKECDIYGTVDFIFGAGKAVFQDCQIYGRSPNSTMTVTAQSKEEPDQDSGFSFHNCNVTLAPELQNQQSAPNLYLGRPWRAYSTVVFLQSNLSGAVNPSGWQEWPGIPVNQAFYGEYCNQGPGANTAGRIRWPGVRNITAQEATDFTVKEFIDGDSWLPETGVPYTSGLMGPRTTSSKFMSPLPQHWMQELAGGLCNTEEYYGTNGFSGTNGLEYPLFGHI